MPNIQFHKGAIDPAGCISNGWNLVKPNYWMYFGISLLSMLMIACIPCVNVILLGPVLMGVYYVLLREMRGEQVDFGMMFKGFEKFVPTFVVGLVQSLPGIVYQIFQYTLDIGRIATEGLGNQRNTDFYQASSSTDAIAGGLALLGIVGLILFVVVNIAWTITFMFALPLLAEHDLSPMDAIKLSAKAGWGNVGGVILLIILQALVALVGVLLLCIGVFFVIPIIYAATAFAYRQVFPMIDQPPVYRSTPPTPDVYGGSFGRGV